MKHPFVRLVSGLLLVGLMGCASATKDERVSGIQIQGYAKLRAERSYEYDFRVVWKAIEQTFAKHKVTERDPESVKESEWKDLTARSLETDWIYGESRDKYQEYWVNSTPRKKYLTVRYQVVVEARRKVGGTFVSISIEEEVEKLKSDGTSDGYEDVTPDSTRSAEILDRIGQSILSLPNT